MGVERAGDIFEAVLYRDVTAVEEILKMNPSASLLTDTASTTESVTSTVFCGLATSGRMRDGSTPLILASRLGYIEIVSLLIKQSNCDFKFVNKRGMNALHTAAEAGNVDVLDALMQTKQFDVNVYTRHNDQSEGETFTHTRWTPLFFASQSEKSIDCIKTLLEKYDADPNLVNSEGQSSLHIACYMFQVEAAKLLILHNADCTLKDIYGATPITKLGMGCDYGVTNEEKKQAMDEINEYMKKNSISTVLKGGKNVKTWIDRIVKYTS